MSPTKTAAQLDKPRQGPTIEALREAIRCQVQATSLRSTARTLRITPTGLQGFLDGAKPYPGTLNKYLTWYLTEADNVPPVQIREVALDVLLVGVPLEDRLEVREGIVRYLTTYRERQVAIAEEAMADCA